jgi:hypothetical protein
MHKVSNYGVGLVTASMVLGAHIALDDRHASSELFAPLVFGILGLIIARKGK